jgi:hypothetical protein
MNELPQDPPVHPSTRSAWLKASLVLTHLVLAVLLARGALWLYIRHNDFPMSYHPDEPSKVSQLMGAAQWNYNHPLLMLEAASLAIDYFQVPDDPRQIAITGRWTSAALASIGVFSLALAGYLAYGTAGLLVGGLTMMLCPYLLVYAHYLKEDASLVAGVMVAILGARLVISAPDEFTQFLATVVLGIGAGAAASGKYVGAGTVVPCLFTLLIARVPHWWSIPTRLIIFACVAVGTVVFINQRAFVDWASLTLLPQAELRMGLEIEHGQTGHNNLALPTPNLWCLRVSMTELMPHLWVLAGLGALWIIVRRQIGRWGFTVGAFLVTFVIELSYNTICFHRYALPITICMYFAASQLAAYFVSDLQKRFVWGHVVLGVCVAAIVVLQGRWCLSINEQFRDDSRQRLREWMATSLPPDARIVADSYADLLTAGDPWRFPDSPRPPQPVHVGSGGVGFASGMGLSPAELASSGYQYVVAASCSYQRFFEPVYGTYGAQDWLDQNRRFYEELFQHGELVWSSKPSPDSHAYVNMEIRVYRISHLAGSQPGRKPGGLLRNLFR